MIVLGITGSSGAGKTTFCKILKDKYNIPVINADEVAKELSKLGSIYLAKIKEEFGSSVFSTDGNLNRPKLANIIYNDKDELEKLNNLTYKYVVDEIKTRVKILEDKGEEMIAIDAPLLFESETDYLCDYKISLIADKDLKVRRICKRDNIEEDVANQRLNIQQTDEYYIDRSDFVIRNNENENLEEKVEDLLNKIKERGMTSES